MEIEDSERKLKSWNGNWRVEREIEELKGKLKSRTGNWRVKMEIEKNRLEATKQNNDKDERTEQESTKQCKQTAIRNQQQQQTWPQWWQLTLWLEAAAE
jgi:hypothetical protein